MVKNSEHPDGYVPISIIQTCSERTQLEVDLALKTYNLAVMENRVEELEGQLAQVRGELEDCENRWLSRPEDPAPFGGDG